MSSIRVGFIGLGDIGLPIAKSLAKKGLPLTIYGRHREVVEEMKLLGAISASSPREVGAASDVVISVLRDIPQTQEVIFGDNGVWEGIRSGATIIISSTIGAEYCQKLYTTAKQRGVQVVDVGLSKSGPTNEEGTFTLMVGGDEDAVERCWPIFEAMAKHIFHVGGIGMGQTYKIVNQLAAIGTWAITRECLNLGLKAGLDLQKLIDVMRVSTGNSWQLQNLDYSLQAERLYPTTKILKRDNNSKNTDLVIELVEKVGANTPLLRFIGGLDAESTYDAYSAL